MNTKIFLLHHPASTERKQSLIKDIEEVTLTHPIEWVEGYSPEDITSNYEYTITAKELSLSLKHQYVINQQIKHNINNIIVFEDDIDLKSLPDVNSYLKQCLEDIDRLNGDILWIGGTFGLRVPENFRSSATLSYFSENFLSRCTHGYILNIKAAKTVLNDYNYSLPVDHLFNHIIVKNKLTSGWTDPFLTQKTVEGVWKSSIR